MALFKKKHILFYIILLQHKPPKKDRKSLQPIYEKKTFFLS